MGMKRLMVVTCDRCMTQVTPHTGEEEGRDFLTLDALRVATIEVNSAGFDAKGRLIDIEPTDTPTLTFCSPTCLGDYIIHKLEKAEGCCEPTVMP